MSRKRFTEREVLMCVLYHGASIPCGICKESITWADVHARNVQRDHYEAVALGGADDWKNSRYVHTSCHDTKTYGVPATSYGSDRHVIAKEDRLTGKTKRGPKRKIPSRPFQKREKEKSDG